MEVPAGLRANWEGWWPGRADEIAADVTARLAEAATAWGLTGSRPLPGGEVGLVCGARASDGSDVVVKVTPRLVDGAAGEGVALRVWAPGGAAPAVLGERDDGFTLCLQRVRPGGSLHDSGAAAEEVVTVVGELAARIHGAVAPGTFPTLAAYAAGDGWTAALAGRREAGELRRLLEPGPDDRLLHVDLHARNVLSSGGPWVVIDPKPCVGDPHADVFAFCDGAPLRAAAGSRERARSLAGIYAAAAGLDGDRLRAWIRLRCLIAAPGMSPARREALGRLAEALDG